MVSRSVGKEDANARSNAALALKQRFDGKARFKMARVDTHTSKAKVTLSRARRREDSGSARTRTLF